jgi:hypothetical protein
MGDEMEDLGDIVLSWSIQQIADDDLYRGKVRDRSLARRRRFRNGRFRGRAVAPIFFFRFSNPCVR